MAITILGAGPESAERQEQRRLTKLIRVGGKLAVLGVDPTSKAAATGWWHIASPGSWDAPQENTGHQLTYARSLCRRVIVSNGYASDFRPAGNVLCPACRERL